jgi:ribosomal protein S18 acetylase RimI-like enzyme
MPCVDALDDPAWAALSGPHAGLAQRSGRAARYPGEMCPLAGMQGFDADALRELRELVPPGDVIACFVPPGATLGAGWEILMPLELRQMVCEKSVAPAEREPEPLVPSDVAAMLALVDVTRPGPFGPRTIEMGGYVGFKDRERLVAMGGERLRPPRCAELSGICTHPDARGRGLAEAVVRSVARGIQARGDLPFLHVAVGSPSEATAAALYERIGFRERARRRIEIARRR